MELFLEVFNSVQVNGTTWNFNAANTYTVSGALGTTIGNGAAGVGTLNVLSTGSLGATAVTIQGAGATLGLFNTAALTNITGLTIAGGSLRLNSDNNNDSFAVGGTGTVFTGSATINVDRAGTSATNNTLNLGGPVKIGAFTVSVTGSNGYNLGIGAVTLSSIVNSTTTLNPTTANLSVASVTSLAPATIVDGLGLGGTTTGNSVTGIISNGTAGVQLL